MTFEPLTDEELGRIAESHRDSWPMGNKWHGTPERPDWGTFCVACKASWPCESARLVSAITLRTRDAETAGWNAATRYAEVTFNLGPYNAQVMKRARFKEPS